MKLDFIVIGGQKCGSTFIQAAINEHPDIEMVEGECPHFESPDYENEGLEKLGKILNKLNQEKTIGIKRPSYFSMPEVPARIKKFNEKIKLIVILRNPLDRLKSAYFHMMKYGFIPTNSLNIGVPKILNKELESSYPRTKELLDFSLYGDNLLKYKSLFGENILVLLYDDLKIDKLSVIKSCYSFLEVDPNFVPKKILKYKPQKVNYSLYRVKFLTHKNRFVFRYNENKTRLYLKKQSKFDKFASKGIKFFDTYILSRFFNDSKKPNFEPELRQKLIKYFLNDITRLEQILNVDLSSWKE